MIETEGKKRVVSLSVRIGLTFLIALGILIFAAYIVLFQNFQNMLTDYTINLMQSMGASGVTTVESELRANREEAVVLSDALTLSADQGQAVAFPEGFTRSDILRMVYVTAVGSAASDGRERDVRGRADIAQAFEGASGIYGPYFNEEGEYVICYSAPVIRDDAIVGVLSVEKDGYHLSELIGNIKFVQSGESYMIDTSGTDIAVSNQEHSEWMQTRYNARELLAEKEDPVTRSIMTLEQKGLDGETGVGSYEWEGSRCYVAYAPIPSTGWVLLTGVREEEIAAMTQSTLHASFVRGPAFGVCIAVFAVLTGMIIFWLVSSMRKSEAINEKLNTLASYDALTGTMNRNSFHEALSRLESGVEQPVACVYVDANGLHELNNRLGHQAGDEMLKAVADVLQEVFTQWDVYRIGGDEFVVLCLACEEADIQRKAALARERLRTRGYEISIGSEWRDSPADINAIINLAEAAMQRDKRLYYQKNGKERQMRMLNQKMEQLVTEKQDADTFLSVLAPEFNGVYFVDLGRDTIRHLYIPVYFEEMLKASGDVFSAAMRLYAQRIARPEYRQQLEQFCRYELLEKQLKNSVTPELVYQRMDGSWVKLRVLKFKTYTEENRETLWIFTNLEGH